MTTGRVIDSSIVHHRASKRARAEAGRARRREVPLDAHAEVHTPDDRNPLAVLQAQDTTRVPNLVPIRYGRMIATPFTYLRGAAAVMAADLAAGPSTDVRVQLCGDAHLSNFGAFAAPDRRLVVDVNDFDETLPGPFEWDVKRLAASLVVAGRNNGLSAKKCSSVTASGMAAYRNTMATAAQLDPLALWYYRVELDELVERIASDEPVSKKSRDRFERTRAKAGRKNSLGALAKLTDIVDGRRVIVPNPPLVTRLEDVDAAVELDRVVAFFDDYRASLPTDRRLLLDRYSLADLAMKVVGVGSVGTRCLIALFESGDGEPLFLQLKEAAASVLEPYLGASEFSHAGERVVQGQRIVQSASDAFLGWSRYRRSDDATVDFYVRQLWDGKLSVEVDELGAKRLTRYARVCGAVLARAHARSGDAAMIAGYLGDDDAFDRALVAFAEAYADRTESDHRQLVEAVDAGEVEVVRDL